MTAGVRLKARRTTGSGPPPDLLFGEIAYSDGDQLLHVGRPAPEPPATFQGSTVNYSEAIDGLSVDIALLDSSQTTQDLAIAAIEADQGAQNTAIADLTAATESQADMIGLLGSTTSDQAAAIADLTSDLATLADNSFSGAYADLLGKPSLFSGAYADLSGKPTIPYGFTYDQQAEPSAPVVGATWRQRSSGGSILGEWEWSGSLWLSSERYAPLYSGVSASATGTNVISVYPAFPVLLTGYSVNLGTLNSPQDSSNYWRFRHGPIGLADVLDTISQSTTAPVVLVKKLVTPLVIVAPDPSDNRPEKVGSAGNLRTFQVITHYKLIKP